MVVNFLITSVNFSQSRVHFPNTFIIEEACHKYISKVSVSIINLRCATRGKGTLKQRSRNDFPGTW
jgi:hypothetical protein